MALSLRKRGGLFQKSCEKISEAGLNLSRGSESGVGGTGVLVGSARAVANRSQQESRDSAEFPKRSCEEFSVSRAG